MKKVYEMISKHKEGHKGGLKVYLIPKNKRQKGDGILIRWSSSEEAKKGTWHNLAMKDWEALAIIEGLTHALLTKKK